jgi:hypothetical protein
MWLKIRIHAGLAKTITVIPAQAVKLGIQAVYCLPA